LTYRTYLLGGAVSCALLASSNLALADDATPTATAPPSDAQGANADDASTVGEVIVTGRFIATGASTATKLNARVLDVPISVAAYTRSFMNAVQVVQIADLYKYMTGVQRAGNTGYDITIRGFKTSANDRNAIMTDGLPGLAVRFGSPPTVGTDHVEIVKGPASLLYGQAQPGGFVNIITKKPQDSQETEIESRSDVGAGQFPRTLGETASIDSTGPIGSTGALAYRFIAEYGYERGFRTNSYERPLYLAPSVTWNLTPDTHATLQIEYRRDKSHYDTYLVAPHKDISFVAPINTTYQEPGDFLLEEGTTATLLFAHEFNSNWTANVDYRYVNHSDLARGFDVVAVLPNFTQVSRRARGQLNKRTYSFVDANLVGKFDLGPISNNVVLGVQAGRETADLNRLQFFNGAASGAQSINISVLNPVYGTALPLDQYPLVNPTTPTNLNDRYSVSDALGFYGSDLITFTPQLKGMVGLRYSKEDLSIVDLKLANVPRQTASNHALLPTGGILYEPTTDLSFYVSYSTSFVPVAASNIDVNGLYSFTPTTANALEEGVKADLFSHRLRFTVAHFDINKQNVIDTFSCPLGTCSEQVGAEESEGEEVELDAQATPSWQIAAGYSHLNARVRKSDIPAQVNAQLTDVPENNAHLWTRYDFDEGVLNGLGVGLGVSYTGQRTGLLPTATSSSTLPLPAYTIADVALYYKLKNFDFTLKVANLFDKTYYESAGFTGDINIVPGAPRTVTFTVRTRF
jgi:iron complex outermembrane receptor protein